MVVRLRKLAGASFWGNLLDCFYCLSLWIAIPFAIALSETWRESVLLWLALSGGAILLERITLRQEGGAPFVYRESQEAEHELLRQEEGKRGASVEPKN